MCQSGRPAAERAVQDEPPSSAKGDFVLGPELAVAAARPAPDLCCDEKVVRMPAGLGPEAPAGDFEREAASADAARLGDPLADFVDLWLALERFHERAALTEEGWHCLTEQLQRPLELRLLERRPATVTGALKALEMARYLMDNLDSPDCGESGDWYRRLRNHLVEEAHQALAGGLLRQPEKRQENGCHAAG